MYTYLLEQIIQSTNASDESTSDLSLIAKINFFTEELFSIIQEKELLSKSVQFNDLKTILEKYETYYKLPEKARHYINNVSPVLSEGQTKELEEILLAYYTDQISQAERTNDIPTYIVVFEEAIRLLKKNHEDKICKWIINREYSFFYDKKLIVLKPVLNDLIDFLSETQYHYNNVENVLAKSYILTLLTTIEFSSEKFDLAYNEVSKALDLLNSIKNSIQKTDLRDYFDYLYSLEYELRSRVLFDFGLYKSSVLDAYESYTISRNLENISHIFRVYSYMGMHYKAEAYLLEFLQLIDEIEDNQIRELWKTRYFTELSIYYSNLGSYDDTIENSQQVIFLINNENGLSLFAKRNIGINTAKKFLYLNCPNKDEYETAKQYLITSINIADQLDIKRYKSLSFIWLGNIEIPFENFPEVEANLEHAINSLLTHQILNTKDYYDYYIAYYDFNKQAEKDVPADFLEDVYKQSQKNLGKYHPLVRNIVLRLLEDSNNNLNKKPLIQHLARIDYLSSLSIRTEGFEVDNTDKLSIQEILREIREQRIALIPKTFNEISYELYRLPFFDKYQLLIINFKNTQQQNRRYFLFKDYKNIRLLNSTNSPIFEVVKTDFILENEMKNLPLYIRFFFDSTEGRHGKFFLIDNFPKNIPWLYNLSSEEIEENVQLMKDVGAEDVKYLFEESRIEEGREVIYWHFQGKIIFKDSLFSSKIEVNSDGVLRLYDEILLKEKLPVVTDIMT